MLYRDAPIGLSLNCVSNCGRCASATLKEVFSC